MNAYRATALAGTLLAARLRSRLISDWRRAWRFASVQAAALLALLSVLQAEVLPLFQFAIPAAKWPWVTAGFGTAIVLLRVMRQQLPGRDVSDASDANAPRLVDGEGSDHGGEHP